MKKGFTLLELLIVVVILGVLALIAAPTLLNAADQAKEGAVKANVSAAASSITSQFALNSDQTAADTVAAVIGKLNTDNKNPFDTSDNAPFVDTDENTAGKVALVAGQDEDNNDIVTIIGHGKGGAEIIRKTVGAPANNTPAQAGG